MPPGAISPGLRSGGRTTSSRIGHATPDLVTGFQARRLEAMERVAKDFRGNKQTEKTPFDLPDLAVFEQKARTLAHALEEFVTIERHVVLAAWKRERLAPPEQRVLAGQTLVVRYLEEDQDPGVAEKNRDNERRRRRKEAQRAAYREANPDAKQIKLSKEEKAESDWSQEGMRFRLRLECTDVACDLDEVLGLTTLKPGDWLVISPRLTVDSRLPVAEQVRVHPHRQADALRHARRAGAHHGPARRRPRGRGLGRGRDEGRRRGRLRTEGVHLRHHRRAAPGGRQDLHPRPESE